jgi:DNA polymerase-3 subunit delta'
MTDVIDLEKRLSFQPEIGRMFSNSFKSGRLSQVYLLCGATGVGKMNIALNVASFVKESGGDQSLGRFFTLFNHPDIRLVIPLSSEAEKAFRDAKEQGKEQEKLSSALEKNPFVLPYSDALVHISIDSIRELINWLGTDSSYPGGKIAIIVNAEKMRQEAANAFLKNLEEPMDDVMIILTTSEPEALLPTIRSRTQQIFVPPLKADIVESLTSSIYDLSRERAIEVSSVCNGSMSNADYLVTGKIEDLRENVKDLFRSVVSGNLAKMMEWADRQEGSRRFVELLLTEIQCTLERSMRIYAGANQNTDSLEQYIAKNIRDFSIYRDLFHLLEDLQHEARLNPQFALFFSNLPIVLHENIKLSKQKS